MSEPTGTPAAERERWRRTMTIEWFPVSDRLPAADEVVLIYSPTHGEQVWIGTRSDLVWVDIEPPVWLDPDGMLIEGVTHWADLPEPPAKCDGE